MSERLRQDGMLLTHLCERQLVDSIVDRARGQHGRDNAARHVSALSGLDAERGVVVGKTVCTIIDIPVRILVKLEMFIGNSSDWKVGGLLGSNFYHLGDGGEVELVFRGVLDSGRHRGRAWLSRMLYV